MPPYASTSRRGIPARKLVLGVAFYGRAFAGVQPAHDGLNQPYAHFEGAPSYAELVEKWIGHDGFVRHWDERAKAPFLWNAATRTFVTYDDPESIRAESGVRPAQGSRRDDVLGVEPGPERRTARCHCDCSSRADLERCDRVAVQLEDEANLDRAARE